MSYNEERCFDEMIHKAIPYLLFCYDNDQKIISNLLRSLFSSINNPSSFQENYNELKKILDDIKLEPERNMKFKVFENQYHSLEQRIRNIEGTYIEFKIMTDRIKKDHESTSKHGKTLFILGRKVTSLSKKYASDSDMDEKRTHKNQKSTIISNIEVPVDSYKKQGSTEKKIHFCPVCGEKLTLHGAGGNDKNYKNLISYVCQGHEGKYRTYVCDKAGNIPECDYCHVLLPGGRTDRTCFKCGKTKKIEQ